MKFLNIKIILTVIIVLISTGTAFSAEDDSMYSVKVFNWVMLALLTLILFIALFSFTEKLEDEAAAETVEAKEGLLSRIWQRLNKSAPIEKEADIMLDHEYDGIKELDNSVPPWLNYIFVGSVIFGIFYLLHFHVFGTGQSMIEEYNEQMDIARIQKEQLLASGMFISEDNVEALTDEASLKSGKERFDRDCAPCHTVTGGGSIGPNLTDDFWVHGGTLKDIFLVVKNGVPEKGMVAWGQQYNPKQIQEVISYVITLRGTNVPGGKAPEGEPYVPEKESADSTKTGTDSTATEQDTTKQENPADDTTNMNKDTTN